LDGVSPDGVRKPDFVLPTGLPMECQPNLRKPGYGSWTVRLPGSSPIEVNIKKRNFCIKEKRPDLDKKNFAWRACGSIQEAWALVKQKAKVP
jgi:hypothetical protein